MLKVEAQQTVTFYKVRFSKTTCMEQESHLPDQVGPDIHLETEGRFHLPDIQPEHRERLFKNFPSKRCNNFLISMIWFPLLNHSRKL